MKNFEVTFKISGLLRPQNWQIFRKFQLQTSKTFFRLQIYLTGESLVKIQQYRHECSRIMYDNSQKTHKIKRHSITCSHIWYVDMYQNVYID